MNKSKMEEKNKQKQQELMFKLNVFEQHIQQLQQQLESVEQGMVELSYLSSGLDELIDSEGKEIFAPVGKGIFAKTKLLSENLIVDVGGKNFVKKSIPETQKIIKEQISKLEEVKKELGKNLEEVNKEVEKIIENAGKNNKN
jgi:prefoldin alpha subunit